VTDVDGARAGIELMRATGILEKVGTIPCENGHEAFLYVIGDGAPRVSARVVDSMP